MEHVLEVLDELGHPGDQPQEHQRAERPSEGTPDPGDHGGAYPDERNAAATERYTAGMPVEDDLLRKVRPLTGPQDLDPLLDRIGDARLVLLGEASHGTSEYYTWRAEISRAAHRGEGLLVHRRRGRLAGLLPGQPLRQGATGRGRPTPARCCTPFAAGRPGCGRTRRSSSSSEWLRGTTTTDAGREGRVLRPGRLQPVGLARRGHRLPARERRRGAAGRARRAFAVLRAVRRGRRRTTPGRPCSCRRVCEDEVVALLTRAATAEAADATGRRTASTPSRTRSWSGTPSAYYRTMVRGGPESWNVRDRHMAETLDRLMAHHGPTREGDRVGAQHPHRRRPVHRHGRGRHGEHRPARARAARRRGRRAGRASARTAARDRRAGDWDAPWERMRVPPARAGELGGRPPPGRAAATACSCSTSRRTNSAGAGHRAIGVVYRPRVRATGTTSRRCCPGGTTRSCTSTGPRA